MIYKAIMLFYQCLKVQTIYHLHELIATPIINLTYLNTAVNTAYLKTIPVPHGIVLAIF